jgi:hypothetical protein
MTGIHREAAAKGQAPIQKLTATVDILRQILAPIGDDLIGLRDRGLRITLLYPKGERSGRAVTVAIPMARRLSAPILALRR